MTSDPAIIASLTALAVNILEPIRAQFGPFTPTSGYRCPQLSTAIGRAPNSQHMHGQAAHIVIVAVTRYNLALWTQGNLDFDQLISSSTTPGQPASGWVPCSYVPGGPNRRQSLTIHHRPAIYFRSSAVIDAPRQTRYDAAQAWHALPPGRAMIVGVERYRASTI